MGIPLTALATFHYAGRLVMRGQSFSARSTSDAKLLTLTKKAKPAPATVEAPPVVPPPVDLPVAPSPPPEPEPVVSDDVIAPESLDVLPDPVETVDATEDDAKPKRRYRRRDLTAESE
jgi:hypothetical protein